jgi:hypothetical protein
VDLALHQCHLTSQGGPVAVVAGVVLLHGALRRAGSSSGCCSGRKGSTCIAAQCAMHCCHCARASRTAGSQRL